jgi:hypothetical protein
MPSIISACFLDARFPKSVFENKTERGREEREKRKRRKQGERKRKGEDAPANSPPEWPECSVCIPWYELC